MSGLIGAEFGGGRMWGHFWDLLLDTSLVLLASYLFAGLVKNYLPELSVSWLKVKSHFGQSLRGLAFSLPLPICSCGVLPVYDSLVKRGVPLAAATTFLIAVPELGVDAVLISSNLMGVDFTIMRFGCAVAVALIAGVIVGKFGKNLDLKDMVLILSDPRGQKEAVSHPEKLKRTLKFAFVEMLDHTAIWILVGLLVAAVVQTHLDPSILTTAPHGLDVVVAALLGIPGYVCATGSTPMVASLVSKGLSPGAAITFLITGPATNVTTIAVLGRLHGKRTVILFLSILTTAAIAAGLIVNFFDFTSPSGLPLQLDGVAIKRGSMDYLATYVFAGLCLWSAFRQGLLGFLKQLLPQTPPEVTQTGEGSCSHTHCNH